ncbi:STB3 [Candida pseudojiufengensis]|uniref:STB3 n=1 Tax=Candida pseudojiufengensis TaxID=497109 RepID=UPI0022256FF3|nr:STB3 [Candida pseudojiufengensis]KAI5959169.1 STB3 [Candida pseudojiufengensis]
MTSNSPTSLSNIINHVIDSTTTNSNTTNKINSHNITTNNYSTNNQYSQQQQPNTMSSNHHSNTINSISNLINNPINNDNSTNKNYNTPQLPFNPQQPHQQNLNYNQTNIPHIKHENIQYLNDNNQYNNQKQSSDNISPPSPSFSTEDMDGINGNNNNGSTNKKSILSTSSPEGIQVASKITPTRLANLLIRKGPLPIRHITSQLSLEVSSFELLSLSKQRRLIMAAMEQLDPINNVVFEKIGWGQWAVRKVDSDYIVTEGTEQQQQQNSQLINQSPNNLEDSKKLNKKSHSHSFGEGDKKLININDLRNQTNLKLGWSKKKNSNTNTITNSNLDKFRRESITNQVKNLHNLKLPNESIDNAIASDSDEDSDAEDENLLGDERQRLSEQMDQDERSYSEDDEEEEEEDDDDDNEEEDDEEIKEENEDEEMFTFDESIRSTQIQNKIKSKRSSPPIKFAKRVPTKFSPPPISSSSSYDSKTRRRKSSSSVASNSISKPSTLRNYHYYHHPSSQHILLNQTRSRLNSIENLDNYLNNSNSNRNSTVSINSPPPAITFNNYSKDEIGRNGSNSALSSSPINNGNSTSNNNNGVNNNLQSQNSNYIHNEDIAKSNKNRRKSSFNESHVRSTLNQERINLQNSITSNSNGNKSVIEDSDTDEEDWQSIGPEYLRQQRSITKTLESSKNNNGNFISNENLNNNTSNDGTNSNDEVNEDEKSAAFALVNLMSV